MGIDRPSFENMVTSSNRTFIVSLIKAIAYFCICEISSEELTRLHFDCDDMVLSFVEQLDWDAYHKLNEKLR